MDSEYTGKDKKLFIVGIEWDGQHPPTQWYRRLKDLTGGIRDQGTQERGGREVSSIERRYKEGSALILQEGMILCTSYSLARELAIFARDDIGDFLVSKGGYPPIVYLGEAKVTDAFVATEEDRRIIDRMQATLGRRGKKPAKVNYVITCLECLDAHKKEAPRDHIINCPKCGGLKIHWRPGKPKVFHDDSSLDIIELWKRTRFGQQHWEPGRLAYLDAEKKVASKLPQMKDLYLGGREGDTVTLMDNPLSEQVYKVARKIADVEREGALEFLDAVLVGRTHMRIEHRLNARIAAATLYFQHSDAPEHAILAELPDRVDVLDAAVTLGTKQTANILINYVANGG